MADVRKPLLLNKPDGVKRGLRKCAYRVPSADLEIHPGLEAVVLGKRHDADRGAAADATLGAEDFGEEVAQAARDEIGVGEAGRANDEVEGTDEGHDIVELAHGLLDAREAVDPGLPGRRIGLRYSDLGPDAAGMECTPIGKFRHLAGEDQKAPRPVERLHLAVAGPVVSAGGIFRQLDAHLLDLAL